MPTKRQLLGQGDRDRRGNESLGQTLECDNHCFFFTNVIQRLRSLQS